MVIILIQINQIILIISNMEENKKLRLLEKILGECQSCGQNEAIHTIRVY